MGNVGSWKPLSLLEVRLASALCQGYQLSVRVLEPGSTSPAHEKFPCALALRLSVMTWQNWETLFLKGRSVRVSDLYKVTWLVNGSTRARTCSNVLQLIQKNTYRDRGARWLRTCSANTGRYTWVQGLGSRLLSWVNLEKLLELHFSENRNGDNSFLNG